MASVTASWTEPTETDNGLPLETLVATRLWASYDGGAEALVTTKTALAATGGGAQSHIWDTPDGTTTVAVRIAALDVAGNETFTTAQTAVLGRATVAVARGFATAQGWRRR